ARARVRGGFTLPNPPRDSRRFPTASGRAVLTVNQLEIVDIPHDRLLLQTIRSHDQYNTTIYGLDDRYRGVRGSRRVVFLNPEDAHEAGLAEGQLVDLVSHFEGEERTGRAFRVVPYSIPRRCAATYFPEANVLVPVRHVAEKSNTPASKSVVISLRKCATA
ncbi:MAG TPA: molybdopterin dinucleotide binding domain-containing protein, partial [Pyrinomonadaceae bacterium]|nr:molybdopterin dinucleotide binding domain-containing protein [Pyrinomonadaceae bacterium]